MESTEHNKAPGRHGHWAHAVHEGALEVHGHVACKPGRLVRLAALPARHAPIIQPHCTAHRVPGYQICQSSLFTRRTRVTCRTWQRCSCPTVCSIPLHCNCLAQVRRPLHPSAFVTGLLQRNACITLRGEIVTGGTNLLTYGIAAAGYKQVRVQRADCDAVDWHPGLHHACLLLPLVSCKPRHLLRQCRCFSSSCARCTLL